MSRLRRFVHSVASGYLVLAANVVYSLAAVPLALHYLPKAELGLWALMLQAAGYLSQIDLGMSGSISRLLIDHKDERQSGTYGGLIQTGWLVSLVQGAIILVIGLPAASLFPDLLKVPADLQHDFVILLRWQCGLLALDFATRICSHLLAAHQRLDIANYSQIAGFAIGLFALWFGLARGQGVFSFLWAAAAPVAFRIVFLAGACWKLRLFPGAGEWGRPSWLRFKEIFNYSNQLFLIVLGMQLINASQTIIITRSLNLDAAAAWWVGTKVYTLLCQIIWRIPDFATSAFCEMIVRREQERLRDRYREIVTLSLSLCALAGVAYALCNNLFVSVWTGKLITWSSLNDVWLSAWLIVSTIAHCHAGLVMMTKDIRFLRYIFFIEGAAFVALGLWLARLWGIPGLLISSLICSAAFTGSYSTWRVARYLGLPLKEVALDWLKPMGKVLACFAPVAVLAAWGLSSLSPIVRLAADGLVCALAGGYFFLRFGLPPGIQREISSRLPKTVQPALRYIFA